MLLVLAVPILPGRAEAWRRVCQELVGSRADQFAALNTRAGIVSLQIHMLPLARGELAVCEVELAHIDTATPDLLGSDLPFDTWLKRQVRQSLGIDLEAVFGTTGERVLKWNSTEVCS